MQAPGSEQVAASQTEHLENVLSAIDQLQQNAAFVKGKQSQLEDQMSQVVQQVNSMCLQVQQNTIALQKLLSRIHEQQQSTGIPSSYNFIGAAQDYQMSTSYPMSTITLQDKLPEQLQNGKVLNRTVSCSMAPLQQNLGTINRGEYNIEQIKNQQELSQYQNKQQLELQSNIGSQPIVNMPQILDKSVCTGKSFSSKGGDSCIGFEQRKEGQVSGGTMFPLHSHLSSPDLLGLGNETGFTPISGLAKGIKCIPRSVFSYVGETGIIHTKPNTVHGGQFFQNDDVGITPYALDLGSAHGSSNLQQNVEVIQNGTVHQRFNNSPSVQFKTNGGVDNYQDMISQYFPNITQDLNFNNKNGNRTGSLNPSQDVQLIRQQSVVENESSPFENVLEMQDGMLQGSGRRGFQRLDGMKYHCGKELTYGVLKKYFDRPLKKAAQDLGVCATTLKRACRREGIQQWPARKVKKLLRSGGMDEDKDVGEGSRRGCWSLSEIHSLEATKITAKAGGSDSSLMGTKAVEFTSNVYNTDVVMGRYGSAPEACMFLSDDNQEIFTKNVWAASTVDELLANGISAE